MTNALDIVINAEKEVSQLDIRNKAFIVSLLMSARRNVAMQLADASIVGFQGAVDTMDKVKAIEDYIKKKRGQSQAELVTQNMVAAERLRIVRDIGKWLEKYLAHKKHSVDADRQNVDELFWLEDLCITRDQSSDWQRVASLNDEDFESWLKKFLDTAVKIEAELYLEKLLHYAKGEPEESPNETMNVKEKFREFYREFGKRCDAGHVSRDEFIREKDDWIKTQQTVETIMRQRGELF